ncbi:MAG TPA: V-type ATPase subunit [Treponemataceae bacterium]|nr:V-type ATPase subunit [Treponemataceae bacterium]
MDRIGADAFVYSKACGMYSRSYVGKRAKKLFEVKRLHDLWALLFEDEVPLVPESMLALLLERKASQRIASDLVDLLSVYDKPDPVVKALLSLFEYSNLKSIISSLSMGSTQPPFMVSIGKFSLFNHEKWPDIAAMTEGTPVSWYNRIPEIDEQIEWESKLDHEYYRSLWASVFMLTGKDRSSVEGLIAEEIILQNIVWAMRLKVYYNSSPEEIMPLLAFVDSDAKTVERLCQPAISILSLPVDSWDEWASWSFKDLLNPHEEGIPWSLDPRWAQLAADKRLYRLALKGFHLNPFTSGVLVCFFKIKQLEEQMIRIAAEGLRLGATEDEMYEFMGDSKNV